MRHDELDAAYAIGKEGGLHADLDKTVWQRLADWAIVRNPFRGELPVGHVLERDGETIGVMYYVYVPFRMGDWRGGAPMLNGLAARRDASAMAGLQLHHELIAAPEFDVVLIPHVNELGAAVLARHGAVAVDGSAYSVTGCLSSGRRFAAAAAGSIGLSTGSSSVRAAGVFDRFLDLAGQTRMKASMPADAALLDLNTCDEELLADLAERALTGLDGGIVRDAAFLRWRYLAGGAGLPIRAVGLHAGAQRLRGLAVLEVTPERDYRMMELIVDSADPNAARLLIVAAAGHARAEGGRMLFARLGLAQFTDAWCDAGATIRERQTAQCWFASRHPNPLPNPFRTDYSHGDHRVF